MMHSNSKSKSGFLAFLFVSAALVALAQGFQEPQPQSQSSCPKNCVPMLAEVCETVVGILEKVPVIEKKVPYVLEIVGRSICFPEDKKNVPNSLCPTSESCGKSSITSEVFSRVCNYVDDILQATPGVSEKIRNLTDHAICAIGNLIPDSEDAALLTTLSVAGTKKSKDAHCPENCIPKAAELCEQVEGILENVPVVGDNSMILDLVGKGICFPDKAKPEPNTLCPKSCGNEDNKEIFTKLCNYVDNILQSIPTVDKSVRNMTDHAICVVGRLIPDSLEQEEEEAVTVTATTSLLRASKESMCPSNCEEKLQKICEFVEDLVGGFPQINELGAKEIGRAICFPKSADKHPDSKCSDDCGDEENEKICEYVDLLMQVPQIPEQARELTAKVICKLGGLFDEKLKLQQESMLNSLRNTVVY